MLGMLQQRMSWAAPGPASKPSPSMMAEAGASCVRERLGGGAGSCVIDDGGGGSSSSSESSSLMVWSGAAHQKNEKYIACCGATVPSNAYSMLSGKRLGSQRPWEARALVRLPVTRHRNLQLRLPMNSWISMPVRVVRHADEIQAGHANVVGGGPEAGLSGTLGLFAPPAGAGACCCSASWSGDFLAVARGAMFSLATTRRLSPAAQLNSNCDAARKEAS